MATPKQFRRRGRLAIVLGTLIAAAVMVGIAGAQVWTDQSDYAPGTTVTIHGGNNDSGDPGYVPGNTVNVAVNGPNGWSDSCSDTVNDNGEWSCAVTLSSDPDVAVGEYSYTATSTDANGDLISEDGTFTDAAAANVKFAAAGLPSGTPVSVDYSGTNNGNQPVSGTAMFTTPADSGNIGFKGSTSLTFSFDPVVGCTLDNTSVSSPTTTPAAGGSTTITGTYVCAPVNSAPSVTIDSLLPDPPKTNDMLTVNVTPSDPDGDTVNLTYVWKVNGTTEQTTGPTTSTSDTFDLSVAGNGDKGDTVSVEVTPNDGTVDGDSDTASVTVANSPPVVDTAAVDANGTEGDTLTASGKFTDADGDTLTISDSSSDGTFSDNGDDTWSWSFPTSDDVATTTDTVTASDGTDTASDEFDYSAVNADPVVAAPTNTSQSNCSVSISASFTDVGTADTHTATIDWGDGNTTTGSVTESNGSGTVTGSHTYAGPGSYSVTVTVIDDDAGSDTSSGLAVDNTPSLVYPQPPIIDGKTFKVGSSIPVKILVTGCTAGLAPTIKVQTDGGSPLSPNAKGKSSKIAGQMRYDAQLPGFIYNWDTKGLSKGFYTIWIDGLPTSLSNDLNYAIVELVKG